MLKILIATLLICCFFTSCTSSRRQCEAFTTRQLPYHWNKSKATRFVSLNSRLKHMEPLVIECIQEWNALYPRLLTYAYMSPTSGDSNYWDADIEIDSDYGSLNRVSMIGVASIFSQGSTKEINWVKIQIQETANPEHWKSILLHELGHALGLGHSNNVESIMYPTVQKKNVQTIVHEDRELVKCIYED
jgi:hypothetical protein